MNAARRGRTDRWVTEPTSSASITAPYPRRERPAPRRAPPRPVHARPRAPADPSSAEATPPTVAMPRGRRPELSGPLPELSIAGDEERLSSADILWSEPLPQRSGGLRAPPAAHAPPAPAADPLIGMIVADRYRIVEAIGRGGMGIVYKVEHTRIGKLLAMKLLTGELSRNPDVVRRFKREALTVSKLSSPNTVQVFDFGVSEGLTYLVMELVTGENLGRVLRRGGPDAVRAARQDRHPGVQLARRGAPARASSTATSSPRTSCSCAAADGADVAKVLDFGLAKLRERRGLNDVTGRGASWARPTTWRPSRSAASEVDARTDIYALGALMYRVATGHSPFSADLADGGVHEAPHREPGPARRARARARDPARA